MLFSSPSFSSPSFSSDVNSAVPVSCQCIYSAINLYDVIILEQCALDRENLIFVHHLR